MIQEGPLLVLSHSSKGRKRDKVARRRAAAAGDQTVVTPAPQLPKFVRFVKWAGATLVSVLGFLALWSSYRTPLDVSWGPPMDRTDALTTPFEVRNAGAFPIYNVVFSCHVIDLRFAEGGAIKNVEIGYPDEPVARILADESQVVYCQDPLLRRGTPAKLDIAIGASYRPLFALWRVNRQFRFFGAHTADGAVVWQRRALKDTL